MSERLLNTDRQPAGSIGELASHALYAAIEAPLSGGSQLFNKVTGRNNDSPLIQRPTGDSFAAKVGDLVGTAALLIGAGKLARLAGGTEAGALAHAELSTQAARTMLQSAGAGAVVGLFQPVDKGSFWSAKLHNTGEFALMGLMVGSSEIVASRSLSSVKNFYEAKIPAGEEHLALSVKPIALAFSTDMAQSESTGITSLPDFRQLPPATLRDSAFTASAPAIRQTDKYVKFGTIQRPFENGVMLPTDVTSAGLGLSGWPVNPAEKFMVVDRSNDPVLMTTVADARERFAAIKFTDSLLSNLSQYSSTLFNRWKLDGPSLEAAYAHMLRRSKTNMIPIGEFLQRGNGVCLQQAALLKVLAEDRGVNIRLMEGVLAETGEPHVWTEAQLENGAWRRFDPAQLNNPNLHYEMPKIRKSSH